MVAVLNVVKPQQITSGVETITPVLAKQYLRDKAPNRNIREDDPRIKMYAGVMKRGDWLIGEPIIFDSEDRLIDGQHRLKAVVKSGATIDFIVVRGVSPSTIKVLDSGKSRTLQHSLTIEGFHVSNLDTGILQAMFLQPRKPEPDKVTDRQLVSHLMTKYFDVIKFSSKTYNSNALSCRYAPIRAVIARAYHYHDLEKLSRFLYILDGHPTETQSDKIPHMVRNLWLVNKGTHLKRANKVSVYAKTMTAVEVFCNDGQLPRLTEARKQLFPVADFD